MLEEKVTKPMVSLLGTSPSSILSCPRLSSTPLTSPVCFRPGKTFGGKLYRRIQSEPKQQNRSRHHVLVTNVATGIKQKIDTKESARPVYPFAAIVGQDEMKLCLLLNVIDPKIGGVMIMGDRGTGKSTTVRSLVDLLPEITVVAGDPYNSDPKDPEFMGKEVREKVRKGEELDVMETKINMVDLPLGATEDRVCGTIDIEKALRR
ncbi:unnamed protein product [Brassica oleracea var. botrytis]